MLGLYLDALSDEQRDRIIEAKDLYAGLSFVVTYANGDKCGCLVGVAEMNYDMSAEAPINDSMYGGKPCGRFPRLIERFGKTRIVAACKARAARGNAPTVTEIRAEVVAGRQRTAFMYGSTLLGR